MEFQKFLESYDKPGFIVLLEGKRVVSEDDQQKLLKLSAILLYHTNHMVFRSGNASGADELFCSVIMEHAPERLELITPYSSHRKKQSSHNQIKKYSIDTIDFVEEPGLVYGTKMGTKNDKLVDSYVSGDRNKNSIKAAYLIRDTAKVLGTSTIPKANFALFYDDLANPKSGGTGHTMKVCDEFGLPYINQETWFEWLKSVPPFPKGSIHSRWFMDDKMGLNRLIKKED
jgi:hypothetical protein